MAKHYVSNKDVSVRIFESDFMEFFTYVYPAVPHIIFIPVIGFALYWGYSHGMPAERMAVLFLAGMLLWTLTEYLVHRFVFHLGPVLEEEVREIVAGLEPGEPAFARMTGLRQKHYFLAHGVHHDFPNDSKRLVMPPSLSIPLAIVFYAAFYFIFASPTAPALFAGLVFG